MVHLLSHLDPMVYFMVVAFAIGFAVVASVLVEILPDPADEPTLPVAGEAAPLRRGAPGEREAAPPA